MSENKLAEDVCRILGHDFGVNVAEPDPSGRVTLPTFDLYGECIRCKKKVGRATVRYADLRVRKFDILNRAKERIQMQIDQEVNKPKET